MSLHDVMLFIPACLALNMIFGPNNLLSLTIGMSQGIGTAVVAAMGRLVAFVIMIAISAVGMGALMAASPFLFDVVKWIGALYLMWLGFSLIRNRPVDGNALTLDTGNASIANLVGREFFVAASNPKAILIFTAFFPQFVEPSRYLQSFSILGALFLILEMVAILVYACAGSILKRFGGNVLARMWVDRVSGTFMIAFAFALMLSNQTPGP